MRRAGKNTRWRHARRGFRGGMTTLRAFSAGENEAEERKKRKTNKKPNKTKQSLPRPTTRGAGAHLCLGRGGGQRLQAADPVSELFAHRGHGHLGGGETRVLHRHLSDRKKKIMKSRFFFSCKLPPRIQDCFLLLFFSSSSFCFCFSEFFIFCRAVDSTLHS